MAWAKNGEPDTLTVAGDLLTITDLTAKQFNQFLIHNIASSNIRVLGTFNNSTGTIYARRSNDNGGTDGAGASETEFLAYINSNAEDIFSMWYVSSINGEEKLMIGFILEQGTTGAANAPNRREIITKYVPSPLTTDITEIDLDNTAAGSYAIDSNVSALGTD